MTIDNRIVTEAIKEYPVSIVHYDNDFDFDENEFARMAFIRGARFAFSKLISTTNKDESI